ncbi:AMP-binding protein, partial [Dactylosporangium sp. NPDC005572]|uniref:AMP-binding protein n=1 Tax=Dactylosporangium sp. NPDC005572 TaxID=3156889 RepID=UPI0033A8B72B
MPVGGATVPAYVLQQAERLGDKPALVDGPTGRAISYRELAAGVERVAAGLAARGFAPGDVLAVYCPNRPEYALAAYGAMAAGGTVTGAHPQLTADELAWQLTDARARLLVTVPELLERALAAARVAGVAEVLVIDGDGTAGGTPFDTLAGHGHPAVPHDAVAALPYSSGTTGLPKGVELTHAALVTNARQAQAVLGFAAADVVLAVAPFCHVIGMNLLLPCGLAAGATVVTLPAFDLDDFLRAIQEYRATVTIVVPPVARALAHHPAVDRYDLSSLRSLGVGAAPLDPATEQRCAERLGCVTSQGLGLTEAGALVAVGPVDAPRRGAGGRLVPGPPRRGGWGGGGGKTPP